jgi:hypothetical protein
MDEAKAYALSDGDIRQLLGSGTKITTYPDLARVRHIDELFDRYGRAILFVPQSNEQSGHWTALIKRGNTIEFFDPYGEPPEAQKDSVGEAQLEKMRMKEPLLAELLTDNPYKIIYNKVQLQELEDDVNTCGRHAVCRLLFFRKPIQAYREVIRRSGMPPDEFVVKMTYDEIGK